MLTFTRPASPIRTAKLPGEEQAPAQQVAGGAHRSRIDIGVGEIATAQQGGDLVGVDPVVLVDRRVVP
jgi:hypothetical protein